MAIGLFFGGAFFGGGFFGSLPTVTQAPGGPVEGPTWQEWVKARHDKKYARLVREEKQLVVQKSRLETKLKKARKKSLPVEGILANLWKIAERLEVKQAEIKRLEIEFQMPNFDDDDEDDIEILLMQ